MKSLLIMRHAKSSWKDTDISDFDRKLNKRGRTDAPLMGELLKDRELLPQLIVSSTAVRAKASVDGLLTTSGYTGDVVYLDSFYLAECITYLESLRLLSDDLERVMVVGHNPGLESLLQMLSRKVVALPTGTIAYLSLPIKHWSELKSDTEAELLEYWVPRDLRESEEEEKPKQKEAPKKEAKQKKEQKTHKKKETAKTKKARKNKLHGFDA